MDSKLVVEQMSGRWKIKHPVDDPLALEAKALLPPAQVTYEWVPRERNKHADRLANEALDAAARGEPWSEADSMAAPAQGSGGSEPAVDEAEVEPGRRTRWSGGPSGSARPRRSCCCGTARPRTPRRSGSAAAAARTPAQPGRARRRRVPRRLRSPGADPSTRWSARRCAAPARPPTWSRPRSVCRSARSRACASARSGSGTG